MCDTDSNADVYTDFYIDFNTHFDVNFSNNFFNDFSNDFFIDLLAHLKEKSEQSVFYENVSKYIFRINQDMDILLISQYSQMG